MDRARCERSFTPGQSAFVVELEMGQATADPGSKETLGLFVALGYLADGIGIAAGIVEIDGADKAVETAREQHHAILVRLGPAPLEA